MAEIEILNEQELNKMRKACNLAAKMPHPQGATVLGTRIKTTPDMAAFANATTARYLEAYRLLTGKEL